MRPIDADALIQALEERKEKALQAGDGLAAGMFECMTVTARHIPTLPETAKHFTWTIYRREPDGTENIVAFVDDPAEIGVVMDEDRQKIDYEPLYRTACDDGQEGQAWNT